MRAIGSACWQWRGGEDWTERVVLRCVCCRCLGFDFVLQIFHSSERSACEIQATSCAAIIAFPSRYEDVDAKSRNVENMVALLLAPTLLVQSFMLSAIPASVKGGTCSPEMLWGDWGWNWGRADGEAHMVALGLRRILGTEDERAKFLEAVYTDAEFEATKVVLALAIQRASKKWHAEEYGLDDAEQAHWKQIMDDMVECRFEGDEGKEALIEAIAERLPKVSGAVPDSSPSSDPTRVSIASALEALKFVELGL